MVFFAGVKGLPVVTISPPISSIQSTITARNLFGYGAHWLKYLIVIMRPDTTIYETGGVTATRQGDYQKALELFSKVRTH